MSSNTPSTVRSVGRNWSGTGLRSSTYTAAMIWPEATLISVGRVSSVGHSQPRCQTKLYAAGAWAPGGPPAVSRPRRLPWAELLRRVFAQDVLQCACGGRRTVVAFVADANLTRSLLTSLGLPAEPATFAPARAPPQAELARHDPA